MKTNRQRIYIVPVHLAELLQRAHVHHASPTYLSVYILFESEENLGEIETDQTSFVCKHRRFIHLNDAN